MGRIAVVKCENYDPDRVKESIRQALGHLGGIRAFVNPGEKVLLKVNLLMKRKPELVTTTHPSVVQALAELVTEAGGKPVIGDSPGGYYFYNHRVLDSVYETCGMKSAAEKSGAELNYNTEMIDVPYPEGRIMKSIKTIKPVVEVDKIINIPKIKTHMMTVYSGAVKNLFGIIPGGYKGEYHLRFDDVREFSELLIDICLFAKPALTIMDAVIGMEGYGPTAGSPRKVGLIIAGSNPFELDVIASRIIGFQPKQIPTIKQSIERGLLEENTEGIEVIGEDIAKVMVKDYKKPTLKVSLNFYSSLLPEFITKWINRVVKPRPHFNYSKCKGCGVCAKSCPPKAIGMKNSKPDLNLNKCIRCFCCHELCGYEAIEIKRPWFVKLILR